MLRNKLLFKSLLFAVALACQGAAMAQATGAGQATGPLTLDEYSKILASKMRQADAPVAAAATAAATSASIAAAMKKQPVVAAAKAAPMEKPDPLAGWGYNGASVDAATRMPMFGEMTRPGSGRPQVVYPGDFVIPGWRVVALTDRTVEVHNMACGAAPAAPAADSGDIEKPEAAATDKPKAKGQGKTKATKVSKSTKAPKEETLCEVRIQRKG